MSFQVNNITSRESLFKIIELFFVLIVFLLFRVGHNGDVLHWGLGPGVQMSERAENDLVTGILTSTVYLFIVMVLLLGIILGDTGKYTLLLFNVCGFFLYIAVGSSQIYIYRSRHRPAENKDTALSMGSMAIITSFMFAVDSTLSVMDVFRQRDS